MEPATNNSTKGIKSSGSIKAKSITSKITHNHSCINTYCTTKDERTNGERIEFNVDDEIPSFSGRQAIISKLHQSIQSQKQNSQSGILTHMNVISGLGGVGKTEAVRKYVHIYKHQYHYVAGINAETPDTARESFMGLAHQLKIQTMGLVDKDLFFQVFRILFKKKSLLVYDNAECLTGAEGIKPFLPRTIQKDWKFPAIIVTTRNNSGWQTHPMNLDGLTAAETDNLLFGQLELQSTPQNKALAKEMCEICGGLPVALHQAMGFIEQHRKLSRIQGLQEEGLPEFLQHFRKTSTFSADALSSESKVLAVFYVTLRRIFERGGSVAILSLRIISKLSPTNIPKRLLYHMLAGDEETRRDLTTALGLMIDYNILKDRPYHFEIHRMVEASVVAFFAEPNQWNTNFNALGTGPHLLTEEEVLIKVVNALEEMLEPADCGHNKPIDVHLVKSGIAVVNQCKHSLCVDRFRLFIQNLGCTIQYSHYAESCNILDVIMEFYQSNRTSRYPDNHETFIKRASRYKENGEPGDGINLLLWLYEDLKHHWPQVSRKRLQIMHSVAFSHVFDSKFETMLEDLTAIYGEHKDAFGEEDPETLKVRQNMAIALSRLQRNHEALNIYEDVLKRQERLIGKVHPDTLNTIGCMASELQKLGRDKEAESVQEEVIRERRKQFGEEHPYTLGAMYVMANIYKAAGNHRKAVKIYEYVLEKLIPSRGEDHVHTIQTQYNLALSLLNENKLDESISLLDHVLQKQRYVLGNDHDDTVVTLETLEKAKEAKASKSCKKECITM